MKKKGDAVSEISLETNKLRADQRILMRDGPYGPAVDAAGNDFLPLNACKGITAAERNSFVRIIEASTRITRHQDLYSWLQGEIQHFIPHEVLISAYGYFDTWQLKLDVISPLPGVRSQVLARCEIDGLLQELFKRWVKNARHPFVLHSLQGLGLEEAGCQCSLHGALRNTNSLLVHGVRDERGGCDSMYVALNSDAQAEGCFSECFSRAPCFLINSLISQIDVSSRKLASLPGVVTTPAALRNGGPFSLTDREQEVLDWIRKGKTNVEIGLILSISCFTVKNHIQRIFQKIGASNRVQAVTIYEHQFHILADGWHK